MPGPPYARRGGILQGYDLLLFHTTINNGGCGMNASTFAKAVTGMLFALGCAGAHAQQSKMTFFVTSTNPGKGADFGGLAGADKYCQSLAGAAGAGGRTWRAYLSVNKPDGSAAVNARERIGRGPWRNARGVVVARNPEELHSGNNINKQTALSEKGEVLNGRGDRPNVHDILTGSEGTGMAIIGKQDNTCGNWTKSGEGSAMLGHHDRSGISDSAAGRSWNSSHSSIGCSMDALRRTGGGGLLYCFAAR